MKLRIILLVFFCLAGIGLKASTTWELKKETDGIKVYTGRLPQMHIKAVKVECTVNATMSQLTALLLDAKAHEDWVYSTKTSYLVKRINAANLQYYSEMSMPWPLTNRDVVVDLSLSQDPQTKVMTVVARGTTGVVPVHKDKIRVTVSESIWTVTPLPGNQLRIEYLAKADPAGAVPAWIANMFVTKGPYETFVQLRKVVARPAYQLAKFDWIKD